MVTFSQRMGLVPMEKPEQKGDIDEDLRNTIWNVLTLHLWDKWVEKPDKYVHDQVATVRSIESLYLKIWIHHLKRSLDEKPVFKSRYQSDGHSLLRRIVLQGLWNETYDLVNFIVEFNQYRNKQLIEALNAVLERENAGYRVVNEQIVPITSSVERSAIESAIDNTTSEVAEHLRSALKMIGDRANPDYRNSIKESISAVEAACQAIARKPGATLGDCLKTIKGVHAIHAAMEQALLKIYGYTSNEGGIRHALNDDSITPTAADANFMLVSCSAFVNFLWTVAAEAGLTVGVAPSKS